MKLTGVDRSLAQVTDGSRFDNVADSESLDGLVLGARTRAVRAAHKLDVATSVLVSAAVSSLLRHCRRGGMSVSASSTHFKAVK